MARFLITPQGYEKLVKELEQLKQVDRHEVIEAIAEARAHGDLSENAEYHAAREKQAMIEAKIADLDSKLARSQVVDSNEYEDGSSVKFGAYVTLLDEDSDEQSRYRIVSDYEVEAGEGYISATAPLARGLMGKAVGSSVEIQTPKGMRYYEILGVGFKDWVK